MSEVERFSLALSELGFVRKGSFNLSDHDFTLDNYAPFGDCQVMLTMDSVRVLHCQILEYWEVQNADRQLLFEDDLLYKTINILKELQNV